MEKGGIIFFLLIDAGQGAQLNAETVTGTDIRACTYTHTHKHTRTRTRTRTRIHTHTHTHMDSRAHTHTHEGTFDSSWNSGRYGGV